MQMVSPELRKHLRFVCAVAAGPEEIFFWLKLLQEKLPFLNVVMFWEDFFLLIST